MTAGSPGGGPEAPAESEERVLDTATAAMRRAGVHGEIYLERSQSTIITVHAGKIESLVQRGALGAGLRVFENGRTAFQFTADLTREGLERAIGTARAIAPYTKQDDANTLPAIVASVPSLVNHDPTVGDVPLSAKMEIAREVERAARAESTKIERTRESSYHDFQSRIWIGLLESVWAM